MSAQSDDDRPAFLPPLLPIEDLDNGLYIHAHETPVTILELPGTLPSDSWTRSEPTRRYLVDATDFMAVQKERDELRKITGLIGVWRLGPNRNEAALKKLLAKAGVTDELAEAMGNIIAQVRAGTF
jgi:hypothetical protein